ncbi:hypothetical protein B0J17DRAFT_646873 [Rhizoctonia solani]|nr:hypothetical protein B0J17DRAFT_646873 [Rhizoctonia solani]
MLSPLLQSPDLEDLTTNATQPCETPTADTLPIDVYNTVKTISAPRLEEYSSRLQPSNTQPVPPQPEWHIVGMVIMTIIILVTTVCLWKYSGIICNGENGACECSAHQAGRSDAVKEASSALIEGDPPHGCNPGRPKHHRQPAVVVSADVPAYHAPLHRQIRDPLISSSREPDCAVANPQGSAPSHGNLVQRLVDAGRHILKTQGWPLINRLESGVVYIPIRSPDPRSLHRSLFTGAHDLGENFLHLRQCLFLLKDAENDTRYLQQMFESAVPTARYECIYGPDATYAKIREMPSQMFMVFTGSGDSNNAMCLSNDQVISESDLDQWLSTTPAYQANASNISVLFDICRTAVSQLAKVFRSMALVWSCSIGEYAYAIRISKDKLIPAAFTSHIQQLNELILFLYHKGHQDRCPDCPPHKRCDPPMPQNPDLQQAKVHIIFNSFHLGVDVRWFLQRTVTNLGLVIAAHFPHHASEVFLAVERKMTQVGFAGRLCPLSVFHAQRSNKSKVNDES